MKCECETHWHALIPVFATGTLGAATFLFAPFLLGGLAILPGWSPASAGLLLAVELCGAASGSLIMLTRRPGRALVPALAALAVANALSAIALTLGMSGWAMLAVLRALCGLSEGAVLAGAYVALALTANPDRRFAQFLAATLLVAGLGFWGFPFLLERLGMNGIFAGLAVGALLLMPGATTRVPLPARSPADRLVLRRPAILALCAILLFFCGQGAAWSFAEQMGAASGLTPATIGAALALSSFGGLLGALASSIQGSGLGRRMPILLAGLAALLLIVRLGDGASEGLYFIVVFGLQLCWCYSVPFFMGGLAAVVDDERLISSGVFMQLAGLGVGPMAASFSLDGGGGYEMIRLMAACFSLASIGAAMVAFRRA